MANLRVGDPHNLLGQLTPKDEHPQYILRNAGLAAPVPILEGQTTFKRPVEFEKGFRFHTDNVAADDPLGDSFHHGNEAAAHETFRTWDASDGLTFKGFTLVASPLLYSPAEANIFGTMSWALKKLDPGDFTAGGPKANGFYTSFFDSDLVLLVNQTSVLITMAILQPLNTIVTVKDITGAVNPDILINVLGHADGPAGDGMSYTISNAYEHVLLYHDGTDTILL